MRLHDLNDFFSHKNLKFCAVERRPSTNKDSLLHKLFPLEAFYRQKLFQTIQQPRLYLNMKLIFCFTVFND